MPLRSPAARAMILFALVLFAAPSRASDFVDAAGRRVLLPAHVERVMAAGPAAAVLLYALAPAKLVGWTRPLSPGERAYLPIKYANLPVSGRLTGPHPTASAATVARLRPDLVIDWGRVSPDAVATAVATQQATGIPYILLDGTIENTPALLREVGAMLGVDDRAHKLSKAAEEAIDSLRGRLLIQPPEKRPRVYYGRGEDGLETGRLGSLASEDIEEAGAVNVAAPLGVGGTMRVTAAQLIAWDPEVIIAERASFYEALKSDPQWRRLSAVRDGRIYLAPAVPFGWIDNPEGINRVVGLDWLTTLFYPSVFQQSLRTEAADFYERFYDVKLNDKQLAQLLRRAAPPRGKAEQGPTLGLLGPVRGPDLTNLPTAAPSRVNRPPGRGGPAVGTPPRY
ncbi:MAG TPA: ABC transporter substrate-binding protein [Stellaceae bacterium]|nr:ABC transporter substrate-binding protein [Stellaceae bacterium]